MSDGQGVLRAVSWRDLCPWLIIFRSFGLAARGSILLVATAAVLATPLGWKLAGFVFVSKETRRSDPHFQQTARTLETWPSHDYRSPRDLSGADSTGGLVSRFWSAPSLAAGAFHRLSLPFRQLFSTQITTQQTAYFVFGALWTLAIWSFAGGVITRLAAVELGREERITLKEAVLFSARKFLAYFVAPLSPLCIVLLVLLLSIPVGWLMHADATLPAAGLLWLLVLVGGFVSAVVLLGLLLGWPLMWATVSSEGTDAFDALSRGYAYTFQRPLHYLFYAFVAVVFGGLCWLLVSLLADAVVGLSYWATGWGAGNARIRELQQLAVAGDIRGMKWLGVSLIGAFNSLVYSVATGFGFSFFWCAATAVYLLLRYDVDQTEFDEIHMEDDEVRYGLPPLVRDEAGVPDVPAEAKSTADATSGGEATSSPEAGDGAGDSSG